MQVEDAQILNHEAITQEHRVLTLQCPATAEYAKPGQFVHLKIPPAGRFTLRRPFSIYRRTRDTITILYRQVGRGTEALTTLQKDQYLNIVGPLGEGFPMCEPDVTPVLVAGGYGIAPLFYLAEALPSKGVVMAGGRTAGDILLQDEFKEIGWDTKVATEDGSLGEKGLITSVLQKELDDLSGKKVEIYACGPDGMLNAISDIAIARDLKAWVSMERRMGCGVGACLACVQKIIDENGEEVWARVCKEGPVFECRRVVWKAKDEA